MKIIGGRDYYDGAGYGVDEEIIFLRKEAESWESPFDLPKSTSPHRWTDNRICFHYVLLGGKVYPMVSEHQKPRRTGRHDARGWAIETDRVEAFHYDADAALGALERLKALGERYYFRRIEDEIARHFRETERRAWTDWMIANKVVTGRIDRVYRTEGENGVLARINVDDLAAIEFFRVLDPATAHMEIANWVGGVLPSAPDTVEITDADRIRAAGFDQRSFRQDPGVKKPRRKRHN